ncbi:MAG: M15 family metallopeptidase [Gemmatimonadaceae bacterium]
MNPRSLQALTALVFATACIPLRQSPPPANTIELPTVDDAAADSLLVDVQRLDSSLVVDARYATPNNFTGAVLPGYEGNRAFLRAEAAAALALVNADLKSRGLGLKIFDAYRPVRASEAMVKWAEGASRQDLLRDGYIASRSRHNLGAAVDVTLFDIATGTDLEMGTRYDYFGFAAHTVNARGVAARNRTLLERAMERQGFENYEKEWWHFSYTIDNPVRFDRTVR